MREEGRAEKKKEANKSFGSLLPAERDPGLQLSKGRSFSAAQGWSRLGRIQQSWDQQL